MVHQPIGRVVSVLESAGFSQMGRIISVAEIPFEFTATLARPDSLELVAVVDLFEVDERAILRRLDGLSRALDLTRSRRTITAILVGPSPSAFVLEAISRVARVLPVGSPVGERADEELRNSLAVLLPLALVSDAEQTTTWESMKTSLESQQANDLKPLLSAAALGEASVRHVLQQTLAKCLDGLDINE